MLLSPTNKHLNNKGDEFTTASDIDINASACEMRTVRFQSRPSRDRDPCWTPRGTVGMDSGSGSGPRYMGIYRLMSLYEIYNREFRRKNTRIFTFHSYSSCWSEFL